jgi:hypothetical protein
MSIALRKPMTLAEFLAWEERQEMRFEFDGTEPVAMAGGTAAHAAIQRYGVLQQTHAGAIIFARKGEDWITELVSGEGSVVRMPEIGIEIPSAELYVDVPLGGSV